MPPRSMRWTGSLQQCAESVQVQRLYHVFGEAGLGRAPAHFRRVPAGQRDDHGGVQFAHLAQAPSDFVAADIGQVYVEQHQGRIEVSSPGAGQGTTVTFWLPAES